MILLNKPLPTTWFIIVVLITNISASDYDRTESEEQEEPNLPNENVSRGKSDNDNEESPERIIKPQKAEVIKEHLSDKQDDDISNESRDFKKKRLRITRGLKAEKLDEGWRRKKRGLAVTKANGDKSTRPSGLSARKQGVSVAFY